MDGQSKDKGSAGRLKDRKLMSPKPQAIEVKIAPSASKQTGMVVAQ
jgi:hypothetical protein